ncbi:MAG: hypothetical protein LLG04_06920 [Parachlamydia sp.]|nr:hypothetical protein [Parachlamydia sp.]
MQPAVTGLFLEQAVPKRTRDEELEHQRNLRPRVTSLNSWPQVAEEVRPAFQLLMDHGVITSKERKKLWVDLIPDIKEITFRNKENNSREPVVWKRKK